MKSEHLKLAGIVTVMCGGMHSLGASAATSDSPQPGRGGIMQSLRADPTVAGMSFATDGTQGGIDGAANEANEASDADSVVGVSYPSDAFKAAGVSQSGRAPVDPVPSLAGASAFDPGVQTPIATAIRQGAPAAQYAQRDAAFSLRASSAVTSLDVAVTSVSAGDSAVASVDTAQDYASVRGEAPVIVATARNVAEPALPNVASTLPDNGVGALSSVARGSAHDLSGTPLAATGASRSAQEVAEASGVPQAHASEFDRAAGPHPQSATLQLGHAVDLTATSAQQTAGIEAARVAATQTKQAMRDDDEDPAWASASVAAIDESRLDTMRGGFDEPSGLLVSFGISRAAFVNGNLVAQTSFNIPDIANMTPQQAQMLASANTGSLIQVGQNNTVQSGTLPGLTGAVIQNSLNNQQIQALTTINTSVNSLGAFKSMNLGSTLNSALISAVRPR